MQQNKTRTLKSYFSELFDYQPRWAGVFRIAGWTLFFLLLANARFPQKPYLQTYPGLDGKTLNPMMINTEDVHWVRGNPRTFADAETNITWVAGSGIRMQLPDGTRTFLPEQVRNELAATYQQGANFWVYYIQAGRPLDMYTATSNAIQRDPAALVIEINPIWALTNLQLYGFENLRNGGAETWEFPEDSTLLLLVSSPGNHFWNHFGRYIPRLPFWMSQNTSQWFDDRISRDASEALRQNSITRSKVDGLELTQGVNFWMQASLSDQELSSYRIKGSSDQDNRKASIQGAIMSRATPNTNVWPSKLLRRQLDKISDSGIPAVVYVSPLIESNISDPELKDAYQAILEKLRNYKSEFDKPGQVMIVDYPDDVMNSIAQNDYVHLSNPGRLAAFLADEIAKLEVNK